MAHSTTPRTISRAAVYGDLFADSALDDVTDDSQVFTDAWRHAQVAIANAAREERRSRTVKARFEDRTRFRAER